MAAALADALFQGCMTMARIGRNADCPCGSAKKYKHCCNGKVDWENLLAKGNFAETTRHLTVRGKNIAFTNAIFRAFGLDKAKPPYPLLAFKNACTPNAVRMIHEAILDIWPDESDCVRALEQERSNITGLYIGLFDSKSLYRGISRHCLYSDSLLICDPFPDPRTLRPEFNPLNNPSAFQTMTLRFATLMLNLIPWMDAGLVKVIKSPIEFDLSLFRNTLERSYQKYEVNPELKAILQEHAQQVFDATSEEHKEYIFLSNTDEKLAYMFREQNPDKTEEDVIQFLRHIDNLRNRHPYYIPNSPLAEKTDGEINIITSGASYEMAKLISGITDSHIVTDIPSKWRELELDRRDGAEPRSEWQDFAKSFGNVNLKFLNNVHLEVAFQLRKEEHLENMRRFLRKLWRKSQLGTQTDAEATSALSDELQDSVNEASEEWKKIDRNLAGMISLESVAAGAAVAERIATGSGNWTFPALGLAGAAAVTLGGNIIKRKGFKNRYPAGFFLGIK
jgi:hypothetical protein